MTKWGDRPHWEFDGLLLGSDEHGDWVGVPAGTPMARPGSSFVPPVDSLVLVPAPDPGGTNHWLGTFYEPGFRVEVYVDITTPAVWTASDRAEGPVLRAVDLDLDVVRGEDGRVWIDDEDEFADHRLAFGYPEEIVTAATAACATLHQRVSDAVAPFDTETPARWLDVLRLSRAH